MDNPLMSRLRELTSIHELDRQIARLAARRRFLWRARRWLALRLIGQEGAVTYMHAYELGRKHGIEEAMTVLRQTVRKDGE